MNNKFEMWLENELIAVNTKLDTAKLAMGNMEIFLIRNDNAIGYLKLIHRQQILTSLLNNMPTLSANELIGIIFKLLSYALCVSLDNSGINRDQNAELHIDKHRFNAKVYFMQLKFNYPESINTPMGKQLEKLIYSF
jgi:hypothetical protein